jgi:DNA-binding NarL/FixJ family response regulator
LLFSPRENVSTPNHIPLVIADDHPIFRAGLREILTEDPRIQIVAECADGEAALEAIRSKQPLAAILDLDMPKMSGLEIAAQVQRELVTTRLIMLTICDQIEIFNRAMDLGVQGYILKDSAPTDLIRAIDAVLRGEYFLCPSLSGRALMQRQAMDEGGEIRLGLSHLTPMERKVLRFIAENRSSSDIAEALFVSPRTIDTHRSNIAHKLGLSGSYALVRFALLHKDTL